MASETSVCQKSNLESTTIPEMPSTSETSEQVMARNVSADAKSCSTPPNQGKESSILPGFLSEITSQLVSMYMLNLNPHYSKLLLLKSFFPPSDYNLPARNYSCK